MDLDKPAGVLVKTTLVDFPGHVATAFFLKGCNLRCPYCYNTGLVLNSDEPGLASVNELFNHLEKRKNVISALAISGGEPLINPCLTEIIKKAKSLGYAIKLDTNGLYPEKLENLLNDSELAPDFVAMDIKTSPARYAKELSAAKSDLHSELLKEKIIKSISIISMLPSKKREFRTVLVPHLITKDDIKQIAQQLPPDASWQFAQFRNENCLDTSYNHISPYLDKQIEELVSYAKTFIPRAELR